MQLNLCCSKLSCSFKERCVNLCLANHEQKKQVKALFLGLQVYVEKFFIFFLSLFLTTMAASSIGFCVGASVRVFAIANLLIALCYVIMMVGGVNFSFTCIYYLDNLQLQEMYSLIFLDTISTIVIVNS